MTGRLRYGRVAAAFKESFPYSGENFVEGDGQERVERSAALLDLRAQHGALPGIDQEARQAPHTDDPEIRETFLRQVGNCPSGRLVAIDKKTGTAVEAELPVSIGLVEDPQEALRKADRFISQAASP